MLPASRSWGGTRHLWHRSSRPSETGAGTPQRLSSAAYTSLRPAGSGRRPLQNVSIYGQTVGFPVRSHRWKSLSRNTASRASPGSSRSGSPTAAVTQQGRVAAPARPSTPLPWLCPAHLPPLISAEHVSRGIGITAGLGTLSVPAWSLGCLLHVSSPPHPPDCKRLGGGNHRAHSAKAQTVKRGEPPSLVPASAHV